MPGTDTREFALRTITNSHDSSGVICCSKTRSWPNS